MGKTAEQRKANRAKRKAARQEKKQKFNELVTAAKNVPDYSDSEFVGSYKAKFNEIWPLMRAALNFVESLKASGEKMDAAIAEIIVIGDKMKSGTATDAESTQFEEKLGKIWKVVRMLLSAATVLTDDKVDDIIEKVLGIGDWVTGIDE